MKNVRSETSGQVQVDWDALAKVAGEKAIVKLQGDAAFIFTPDAVDALMKTSK